VQTKTGAALTRKDIARAAGVSVATVSYVLSGNGRRKISPATQRRVCEVAEKLGYVPNFSAQALSTGKSMNIGFLSPYTTWLIDPMFHAVQFGLITGVNETSYTPICFYGANEKFFQKLKQLRLDGIVVFSSALTPELIFLIQQCILPIVFINTDPRRAGLDRPNISTVSSDYPLLVQQVFERLLAGGARHTLALLDCRSEHCQPNEIMAAAFWPQVEGAKGRMKTTLLQQPGEEFIDSIHSYLKSGAPFDAVYEDINRKRKYNFVSIAREYNLEPGRDYRLIRSDTVSDYPLLPGETRFSQPLVEIGRTAWQVMERMLQGTPPEHLRLPFIEESGSI
jgi:DNA-binding LacI/PurR family transcriptional regulator